MARKHMPKARVIQITDTHLLADPAGSYRGVVPHATLAAVLEHARRHGFPADALLLTGDLVDDESPAGYATLAAMLEPLEAPALCIPGNHDDPQALAALNRGRVRVGGAHRVGAWQVVLLHSEAPGAAHGRLAPAQLAFLERALGREPTRPALVALHHPPLAVGSRWIDALGLHEPETLFEVLARHRQVRAVAFGHAHQAFDAVRDGVRYLGTPSTCVQFLAGADEFALDPALAPGYRWFELGADGGLATGVERVPLC